MAPEVSEPLSERRRNGRFYTPASVADLTVAMTVGDRWPPRRLLDPSCGDGALLAAASRRGLESSALVGRDNDAAAISQARAALPGAELELVDLFDARPSERFPAIVGNPPYVRSDRVGDECKQRMTALFADVSGGMSTAWQGLIRRGDLAACALLRSVALLEDGGRLGFVVSAALLEADYAQPLWAALAELGTVADVISAPAERWFKEAAVNTIIIVFERGRRGPTRIARLRVPTPDCAARVRGPGELGAVADVRTDDSGSPRRWAELLRAPRLWLELCESPALVSLGEIATVRRGMTSGANDIFYFTRERAEAESIERELLSPLVRAPARRGDVAIRVDGAALDDFILRAPADVSGYPNAARYLELRSEAQHRPSLSVREPWWMLPSRPAQIFLAKAYARRFVQRYAPQPLECDQRVYAVAPKSASLDPALLAAVLNGSLTALAIEALGRASMGEGALEWTVADARSLPIIDPRGLSKAAAASVLAVFDSLSRRPIGTADHEAAAADRGDLDLALTAHAPALAARCKGIAPAVAAASSQRESRKNRHPA